MPYVVGLLKTIYYYYYYYYYYYLYNLWGIRLSIFQLHALEDLRSDLTLIPIIVTGFCSFPEPFQANFETLPTIFPWPLPLHVSTKSVFTVCCYPAIRHQSYCITISWVTIPDWDVWRQPTAVHCLTADGGLCWSGEWQDGHWNHDLPGTVGPEWGPQCSTAHWPIGARLLLFVIQQRG
jgi:hypothetical protein